MATKTATDITSLEQALNGASRENRFKLTFVLPSGVSGDVRTLQILSRSTTIPGKNYGQIEIKHSGKTARIKGDEVTDATWTTEFLIPKDASKIYKAMEQWFNLIKDYKTNMEVYQLDITNKVVQKFVINGVWVQALPGINWSTENENTIKSFEVTFSADKVSAAV